MTVPGHKVVPLDLETMRACAEHMLAEDAEVLSPDVLERFTLQLLGHRPVRCSAPGRSGCGCVPSPVEGCLRESSTLNVLPGPSMPCATTTRTTTTSARRPPSEPLTCADSARVFRLLRDAPSPEIRRRPLNPAWLWHASTSP
jgi:hypothetical protein